MSIFYKLAYFVGFTPWEKAAEYPPAKKVIHELFDRLQAGREAPFGKALDIGCGRGHWAIELAKRGWEVTGVDLSPRAVEQARELAAKEGVDVRFLVGDITALDPEVIGEGYKMVWDFGTVHGLTTDQQDAVGRGVSKVAADDAVLMMLAWVPGRRGPIPAGMSPEDIERAYAGWKIRETVPLDATGLPKPLRKVGPKIYSLEKTRVAEESV